MVQSTYNLFLNLFIIVLIYLSYSYAPAVPLWSGPLLNVPGQDELKECWAWLQFHGLYLNDTLEHMNNMAKAKERTTFYDGEMHIWAACFAYFLTGFNILTSPIAMEYWSTETFCERYDQYNEETQFVSLQNAAMTCNENMQMNVELAVFRRRECDNDPHLLVTMYSRYVDDFIFERSEMYPPDDDTDTIYQAVMTPPVFCETMENILENEIPDDEIEPIFLPYANLNTLITCKEWIHFSGYSNNIGENVRKAYNQSVEVKPYLSKWTSDYIDYIIRHNLQAPLRSPGQFCIHNGLSDNVTVYYDRVS